MSLAKLAFVEKQDGQVAFKQNQSRKCGSKPCAVEAAVFKKFLILVATCTVVAGLLVLKRGLQVGLGASFDGKQLLAAPLLCCTPGPPGSESEHCPSGHCNNRSWWFSR